MLIIKLTVAYAKYIVEFCISISLSLSDRGVIKLTLFFQIALHCYFCIDYCQISTKVEFCVSVF